ncbi:MAG: hypothetical protein ACI9O6_001293 [Glaciecola sp.]|jgi:hypothetical protein
MTEEKQRKMALRRDAGYRKPSVPSPKVYGPEYAMSFACFICKTAHKRHFEVPPCDYPKSMECPICKEQMANVGRYFKAPKKSEESQWKKVRFLVDHGFVFQHVYEQKEDGGHYRVDYPKTLSDARKFVVKFKEQAWQAPL